MPKLLEKESEVAIYHPSKKEQDTISAIWQKWMTARDQRLQTYRVFNDRDLVDYINDSVDRFNGYIPVREDPASDWGAHVFNNVTRAKAIAIVANITAERVRSEFFPQNLKDETDLRFAALAKQMDDYAYEKNNDDEHQLTTTLEATMKGTSVSYEGYKREKRKIKEIDEYNFETGEIKYTEKEILDWDDVFSEHMNLFDFYPGNIWVPSIQKQPFIIWRTVMDTDRFRQEFGKYRNADLVEKKSEMLLTLEDDRDRITSNGSEATASFISENVLDEQIEVIRYFNRWTDEFHVLANGILLTPLDNPFPWDHKKYPFYKTIFEPIVGFFYGKSLPDKLRSNQDVLNDLYRMMLDQSFLSINPPILTTGVESIRDEMIWPGRRLIVDDVSQTQKLDIPAPQNAHFQMIKMVEDVMKKESVDDPSAGISGSRTSAFEVGVAKEAAQKLLSLFLRMVEYGVRDKTELRIKNILQFYRIPKIKEIAEKEYLEYRTVTVEGTTLQDGTKGRQVIRIVGDETEIPSRRDITLAEIWYLARGQNIAFSFITADALRDLELRIKIIPNSSLKMSEALRRALELDYQQKANLLYPDLLNREEAWREFNLAFDKDPEKLTVGPAQPGLSPLAKPTGGTQPNAAPLSGPNIQTQGSAAAAGVPTANVAQNISRNFPAA